MGGGASGGAAGPCLRSVAGPISHGRCQRSVLRRRAPHFMRMSGVVCGVGTYKRVTISGNFVIFINCGRAAGDCECVRKSGHFTEDFETIAILLRAVHEAT